ncbi:MULTISPECIES: hypothetical protein [Paenibacillus]|jgi:hypothetical protein|uniref:DUF1656 domain-containing protein n=1 Tax=Paenibacillus baimaensis TaxID=2982185 RepID=A0ABT2ULC7_9BACL|nr:MULTISPECIES: hypothetical protein [unclassified Paenibacillus]MCU6795453.1 hypothetical protein [Paenibacillus sp. WQ 127069]
MIPTILVQVALIIIIIRSLYVVIQKANLPSKFWLDILFHISVALIALHFLL